MKRRCGVVLLGWLLVLSFWQVAGSAAEHKESPKGDAIVELGSTYTVTLFLTSEDETEEISFAVAREGFSMDFAESLLKINGLIKPKEDGRILFVYELTKTHPVGGLKKATRFLHTKLNSSVILREGVQASLSKTKKRSISAKVEKSKDEEPAAKPTEPR